MAQILKKNILSIVCGVVVILAVVAYFVFVTGLYTGEGGLQAKAQERQSKYQNLQQLITKDRKLPVVELNNSPTPVSLEVFPVPDVIKKGSEITEQLKGQSAQIVKLATQINQRPPLLPNFFPKPNDADKFRFRDRYEIHMTKELPAHLMAASPPTETDLQDARTKLWYAKYADQIVKIDEREVNREQVEKEYYEECQGLLEKLERETAQKYRMYIESEAINRNQLVLSQDSPPTEQIWYAQTATWVQDDLADALAQFNDRELQKFPPKDRNIINAPVKHLINMQVPQGVDQYIAKSGGGEEGAQPGALDYTLSPTGRNSNSLYDVVKFTMVVKVDARYAARLVQELSRGKFITVHKVNLTAVDNALAKSDGFVYGTAPIVQVQLAGEALLMREWTSPLVPDTAKKNLPQFTEPTKDEKKPETASAQ